MAADEEVETQWKVARGAWPAVDVPLDVYATYVRDRSSTPPEGEHDDRRFGDLYLACACARGDARALAAFEGSFFAEIGPVLSRLGQRAPPLDEARQQLRERLFAGDKPKIAEYAGRGDLKGWFRVVVLRTALNATARQRSEVSLEEHAFVFLAGEPDPELEYMKQLYRAEFVAAFGIAVRNLDDEDRSLLRQAFLDGLTVDVIGETHGVHRATAARWVKRAHGRLVQGVHAALQRRLELSGADYESILRLIASRLELSLGTFLGDER